ncbi:MAG: hypothetical protein JWP80_712 [Pseudomonas sp.]|nr:hypothetical protein [Pseudomonas sp.]
MLYKGHGLQEVAGLRFGAEPHHALDASTVVPTAIEDHYFARCGQVRQVALQVHLALFPIRRRRQCHHPKDPRAHPLGERLDCPALASTVAPLKDNADLDAFVFDPLLQLDQFDMLLPQLIKVVFVFEFRDFSGRPFRTRLCTYFQPDDRGA